MSVNHLMDLQIETVVEDARCPVSSQDANQVMIMKVEEVSDMQEDAVPVPIPWHAIKAECEVSRVSLSC
jgi:hypothetical protein